MLHRLRRGYEFHNVELNLLGGNFNCCYGSYCGECSQPRAQFGWIAGVRYFQFGEDFEFAADEDDLVLGNDLDELYYQIDVDNHLIGLQVGGNACYRVTNCIHLRADARLGVYGNHITHSSFIGGANGAAIVTDPLSPNLNQPFDIASTKNDVAFIGELDLGGVYRISDHWSAAIGYRATAVSGVALAGDYGSLTLNADGTYSYVVDNGDAAVNALRTAADTLADVFTYTVRDTAGAISNVATVRVNVK